MTTQLRHSSGSTSMNCLSSGLIGTRPSGGLCQPTTESSVPTSNYELPNSLSSSLWSKSENSESSLLFGTGSSKPWCAPGPRNLIPGSDGSSQRTLYYRGHSPTPYDVSSPQEPRIDTSLSKTMTAYSGPTTLSDSTTAPSVVPSQTTSDLVETDMAKLLDDTDSPSDFTLQNQSDPDSVEAGCCSDTGPSVNVHLLERTTIGSTNEPYTVPNRTPYLNQLFCAKALFCESAQADPVSYASYDSDFRSKPGTWDGAQYDSSTVLNRNPPSTPEELAGPARSPLYPSGLSGVRPHHTHPLVELSHVPRTSADERHSPFPGFGTSNDRDRVGPMMASASPQIAAYVAAAVAAASVSHHTVAAGTTTETVTTTTSTTTAATQRPPPLTATAPTPATTAHLSYSQPCPPTSHTIVAPLPSPMINTHVAHKHPCPRLNPYDMKSFAGHPSIAGPPFPFPVQNPYLTEGVHSPVIPVVPPPTQAPAPPPPHLMHHASSNYATYAPLRHFGPHLGQPGYGFGLDGTRRKNATRESTTTLKVWLQEHIKNPYPSKGEKIMLAIITKMTLTQVSTWFANARRRLKKENKMSWHQKTNNSSSGGGRASPVSQHPQQKHSTTINSNTVMDARMCRDTAESRSQDDIPNRVPVEEPENEDEDDCEADDTSCTDDDEDGDEEVAEQGDLCESEADSRQRYATMKSPNPREHSFQFETMRSNYVNERNVTSRREFQAPPPPPPPGSYLRHMEMSSTQPGIGLSPGSIYADGSMAKRFHSDYTPSFPSQPMIDLMRSVPSTSASSNQFRDHHRLAPGQQLVHTIPLTDSLIQKHGSYMPLDPLSSRNPQSGSMVDSNETESQRTPTLFEHTSRFGDPSLGYNFNPFRLMDSSYDSNLLAVTNSMAGRSNIPLLSSQLVPERSHYESVNTTSFSNGSDGTRPHTGKLR